MPPAGTITLSKSRLGLCLPPTTREKSSGLLCELLTAIEDIQRRYQSVSSTRLRSKRRQSFEDISDGIFASLGPRLYPRDIANCEVPKTYTQDYQIDLYYDLADDHNKLQLFFRELLLEKCNAHYRNQQRKLNREDNRRRVLSEQVSEYTPGPVQTPYSEDLYALVANDVPMFAAPTATMMREGSTTGQQQPGTPPHNEGPRKRTRLGSNIEPSGSSLISADMNGVGLQAVGPSSRDADNINVTVHPSRDPGMSHGRGKGAVRDRMRNTNGSQGIPLNPFGHSPNQIQQAEALGHATMLSDFEHHTEPPNKTPRPTSYKILTVVDWNRPEIEPTVFSATMRCQEDAGLRQVLTDIAPLALKDRSILHVDVATSCINPWEFIAKHGCRIRFEEKEAFGLWMRAQEHEKTANEPCFTMKVVWEEE